MLVQTQSMADGDYILSVDASAMTKVLDSIATQFSNFSQGQNVHAFTPSGFPAGPGVFTASNTSLPPSTVAGGSFTQQGDNPGLHYLPPVGMAPISTRSG